MKPNVELIKDAAMILGGLAFYITFAMFLVSKMTMDYSLNLM